MSLPSHPAPDKRPEQRFHEQDAGRQSFEDEAQETFHAPQERSDAPAVSPLLPEIPGGDLELDLDSILSPSHSDQAADKVKKRASNVLKLSQENEKLNAELKAMTDRLEAAERRRQQLARKEQHIMEPPSS